MDWVKQHIYKYKTTTCFVIFEKFIECNFVIEKTFNHLHVNRFKNSTFKNPWSTTRALLQFRRNAPIIHMLVLYLHWPYIIFGPRIAFRLRNPQRSIH